MLTDQEKVDFAKSTVHPMAAHTLPFLTQIIGVSDEMTGEHCGTGFFCTIEGRRMVVTASHVVKNAFSQELFKELAFTNGSGERPVFLEGEPLTREDLDLAIYPVSRDFVPSAQKMFLPEDHIERDRGRLVRDYLFIQGFPGRFSQSTIHTGGPIDSRSLAYGAMMRCEMRDLFSFRPDLPGSESLLPDGYLEDHQFALNFSVEPESFIDSGDYNIGPEARASIIEDWSQLFERHSSGPSLQGAFGLSGSPVWRIGASGAPTKDWNPRASKLVGIVTHWSYSEKVLIATAASKLFEMAAGFNQGLLA